MNNNKVSVIVPISKEPSEVIRKTIYSLLHQSFQDFEVVITGSFSSQFIASFENPVRPKLKFIQCEEEHEALARKIGIDAALGDLIFFLLPGDIFHPDKIRVHLCFREDHPEAIMTFNPHFVIGKEDSIWFQSDVVTDANFVNSFINLSITLSDIVINKDWILKTDIFTSDYGAKGSDLDFIYRFVLDDGKVFKVNRHLNSNLFVREFFFNDQDSDYERIILAIDNFISDERCPEKIKVKRNVMVGKIYTNRAHLSFFRGETFNGQEWIRNAIRLDRSILDNQAEGFLKLLTKNCLIYTENFETIFRKVIAQLPPELEWISKYLDQSIAKGYLITGISKIFWGREQKEFKKALSYKINIDLRLLVDILKHVSYYQAEFGLTATTTVVNNIGKNLAKIGQLKEARWLGGTYYINQAFFDYHNSRYAKVPSFVIHAIIKQPNLILNRGVLSIFFQSLFSKM